MNFKDLTGPIQLIIYIAILLLSAGVMFASITYRVNTCEKDIIELQSNHDLIVGISEKIVYMQQDIAEVKSDLKEIRKNVETHIEHHIQNDK